MADHPILAFRFARQGWAQGAADSARCPAGLARIPNPRFKYPPQIRLPCFDKLLLIRDREITTLQGRIHIPGRTHLLGESRRPMRGSATARVALVRRANACLH